MSAATPDAATRGTGQDLGALERRVGELWNQCVVMERLHGTLDHAEVLAGLQDVVINVVGSEELAVYEPRAGGWLEPVQTFGVDGRALRPVREGAGLVGRVASERRGWVVGDGPPPPGEPDVTACVPLVAGDELAGVLVVWRLLAHKGALGPADREVLDLVARHAATALLLTARRGS